jgi:hypothetical protein
VVDENLAGGRLEQVLARPHSESRVGRTRLRATHDLLERLAQLGPLEALEYARAEDTVVVDAPSVLSEHRAEVPTALSSEVGRGVGAEASLGAERPEQSPYERGARRSVVLCGPKHRPSALLLPLAG